MKKLKIIAVFLVSILMAMSFSACRQNAEENNDFVIVTSFYPMYVFTKNMTEGADVEVVNMTKPDTGCLHNYQLLPQDIKTLENADVFVINGGGMESFMEKVYENEKDLKVITACEGIELMEMPNEESGTHEHGEFNSHVWTYIPNAITEIGNIAEGLCSADPKNEQIYRENSKNYIESLEEIHKRFEEELKDLSGAKIVVTHEAFDYLADGYGLEVAGHVLSGHEEQASAGEISALAEKIKSENVVALFKEPQYAQDIINTLSEETSVPVYELDPMVTGGEDYIGVYEETMLDNLETIKSALSSR